MATLFSSILASCSLSFSMDLFFSASIDSAFKAMSSAFFFSASFALSISYCKAAPTSPRTFDNSVSLVFKASMSSFIFSISLSLSPKISFKYFTSASIEAVSIMKYLFLLSFSPMPYDPMANIIFGLSSFPYLKTSGSAKSACLPGSNIIWS